MTVRVLVFLMLVFAASAAAQDDQNKPRTWDEMQKSTDNRLQPAEGPVKFASEEGAFTVIFPSGCAKVATRMKDDPLSGGGPMGARFSTVFVFCDRNEEKGEGASVTSLFFNRDLEDNLATPDDVIEQLKYMLEQYGAQVVKQTPIRKQLDEDHFIEGLELLAQSPDGKSHVWLRGLLDNGDIFILAAWKVDGGLWDDPEYAAFFNSFKPGTD